MIAAQRSDTSQNSTSAVRAVQNETQLTLYREFYTSNLFAIYNVNS